MAAWTEDSLNKIGFAQERDRRRDKTFAVDAKTAEEELHELEGEDGIILVAVGTFNISKKDNTNSHQHRHRRPRGINDGAPLLERDSIESEDCIDILTYMIIAPFCCCVKSGQSGNIIKNLNPPYWQFIAPTLGLERRNLDYASLHEEINELNYTCKKLYGSVPHRLRILSRTVLFLQIIFVLVVGILSYLYSRQQYITFLIIGGILLFVILWSGALEYFIVKRVALRTVNDAKQGMLDYIEEVLNVKYPDIEWVMEQDGIPNIDVKCMAINEVEFVDAEIDVVIEGNEEL